MKILIPTDGSETSLKAVRRGIELAEREGAEITLMAVAYYSREDLDELPPNIQEKLDAEAAKALRTSKALFAEKGLKVETVLEAGYVPANNIIAQAEKGRFDQILMGSRGITGIERLLIGSTAAKVVANAPCTVTVIR